MAIRDGAFAESATRSFIATDVTNVHRLEVDNVPATMPAGAVAKALAERMLLPPNTPYALRNDETSAYLEEDAAIGDQLSPNASVTLTPRAHLGATSVRG